MIRSVREALALLRREAVLPMQRLVDEIAGEPVKGSWWGHPRGKLIYAIASALEDSGELVAIKAPKVVFLHRALWPAWLRVVTADDRRRARIERLDEEARTLLATVERDGQLRNPPRKPREAIERAHLAHAFSEHTEHGKHVTVVETWARWAGPELLDAAKTIALDEAIARFPFL